MPATTLARKGGAVRLSLSARTANDLDALQKSLKSLAERLGHPNCATGCDTLYLELERSFVVRDDLELLPQDPLTWQAREPVPFHVSAAPAHAVMVMIPDRVNDNIKSLQKAVASTVAKLGCPACCSGFDILFQRELDLIAVDDKLGLRGFGRFR